MLLLNCLINLWYVDILGDCLGNEWKLLLATHTEADRDDLLGEFIALIRSTLYLFVYVYACYYHKFIKKN